MRAPHLMRMREAIRRSLDYTGSLEIVRTWRGVQAHEQVIKRALFDTLLDESEVERIFLIIKAQGEY